MLDRDVVAAVGVHQRQPDRVVGPAGRPGRRAPRADHRRGRRPGRRRAGRPGRRRCGRRRRGRAPRDGGRRSAAGWRGGSSGRARRRSRRSAGTRRRAALVPVGHGRHPVIRSAASRPLISTIGTPTPGCTDEPARTTFSGPRRGSVDGPERAGLPEGVRQGERGAGGHALGGPVPRRRHLLDLDGAGQARPAPGLEGGEQLVPVARAEPASSRCRGCRRCAGRGSAWARRRSAPGRRRGRGCGRCATAC